MTPELDMLDQLVGGPKRLSVLLQLFDSAAHAQRAIGRAMQAGHIRVLDEQSRAIEAWEWQRLCREGDLWNQSLELLTLDLTELGGKFIA